ncbi:MAG: hypothetical protein GX945_16295 [Lentisphaerae bacterium]|jgi:hypothetical protein|nr:hypothetical protein [Lentisphaerota bacterium]
MIYEPETLAQYRDEAKRLDYRVLDSFYDADITELVDICNGVGGRGSVLTPAINFAYRRYQSCSSPHDWAYHIGGSDADRKLADADFEHNLLIRWRELYGKTRYLNPLALWERNKIRLAYKAVRLFGHKYFNFR